MMYSCSTILLLKLGAQGVVVDAVAENSKKYFDKYGKLKRTEEALTEQIADTRSEIEHLESVSNALDIALAERMCSF